VILTLGLFIFFEALAPMIWGGKTRSFPTHFSNIGIRVGSGRIALSPYDIFTLAAVVALMGALILLFQGTNLGLRMRAAAFAPEVSRLLGISVGRMLTLGWALAALVGALSGVLIAPVVLLSPNFMDSVLVFGFTAAILGGLDSPIGAVVGGLGMGLVFSYIGGYLSPELETIGAFVVLMAVLMVRPEGIFAAPKQRRV
jgi:branched-chain amino acid transport system permease protein